MIRRLVAPPTILELQNETEGRSHRWLSWYRGLRLSDGLSTPLNWRRGIPGYGQSFTNR